MMRCLKAFRERIAAKHPDSQTAEVQIRIALINRFRAPGCQSARKPDPLSAPKIDPLCRVEIRA
jgi:hypothetical protein